MGRNKYSEEERDTILRTFIRCTKEIMETEGIECVSTRKLAALTGYNSAKLYFYYKNIDDLVTMASVGYLEKYCGAVAADMDSMPTTRDFLFHTWEIFCCCAFAEPAVYYRLFFAKRETDLQELMDEYYRLYPAQLEKLDPSVRRLLRNGSLTQRNRLTLEKLADDEIIDRNRVSVINELLISYFERLLEERMRGKGGLLQCEELKCRFMDALSLLIDSASAA